MGTWSVILLDEVDRWFLDLCKTDPDSATLIEAAINVLELEGPSLGQPLVKTHPAVAPPQHEGTAARVGGGF